MTRIRTPHWEFTPNDLDTALIVNSRPSGVGDMSQYFWDVVIVEGSAKEAAAKEATRLRVAYRKNLLWAAAPLSLAAILVLVLFPNVRSLTSLIIFVVVIATYLLARKPEEKIAGIRLHYAAMSNRDDDELERELFAGLTSFERDKLFAAQHESDEVLQALIALMAHEHLRNRKTAETVQREANMQAAERILRGDD